MGAAVRDRLLSMPFLMVLISAGRAAGFSGYPSSGPANAVVAFVTPLCVGMACKRDVSAIGVDVEA